MDNDVLEFLKKDEKLCSTTSLNKTEAINITKRENGKINLDKSVLEKVLGNPKVAKYPVAIYSVAGPFRTGKSFLLNLFVRYLERRETTKSVPPPLEPNDKEPLAGPFKFQGGVSEGCTEGIWITKEPFIISTKTKKKVALFLMDTQGAFDQKSSIKEGSILFALSLLLSSYQFFNLKTNIDSLHLQALGNFAEYAQNVRDTKSSFLIQNFMFLIRDWKTIEDHQHGLYGGKCYLNTVLDGDNGADENVKTNKFLKENFSELSCYLWPSPDPKIEGMGKNSKVCDMKDVGTEFMKKASEFFEYLCFENENLMVKREGAEELNCRKLYEFASHFADVISQGSIDTVESYFEAGKAAKMEIIFRDCVEIYRMCLLNFGNEPVDERHERGMKKALNEFQEKSKHSNKDLRIKGRENLQQEIDKIYRLEQKKEKNNTLLEKCVKMYRMRMKKDFSGIEEFLNGHSNEKENAENRLKANHIKINDHSEATALNKLKKDIMLMFKSMKGQVEHRYLENAAETVAEKWFNHFENTPSIKFEERCDQVQSELLKCFDEETKDFDKSLNEKGQSILIKRINNFMKNYLIKNRKLIENKETEKHKKELEKVSYFTPPSSLKSTQVDLLKASKKRTDVDLDVMNGNNTYTLVEKESNLKYEEVNERNRMVKMGTGFGTAGGGVVIGVGVGIVFKPVGIALGVVAGISALYGFGAKNSWW
ncbi:atlastin-3-like [Clavelina lepadiformis]|uniref:atlastin-3-like n=1 Tax=Clavelina lepadiformis TaxID=159417 RepID=UPI0040429996